MPRSDGGGGGILVNSWPLTLRALTSSSSSYLSSSLSFPARLWVFRGVFSIERAILTTIMSLMKVSGSKWRLVLTAVLVCSVFLDVGKWLLSSRGAKEGDFWPLCVFKESKVITFANQVIKVMLFNMWRLLQTVELNVVICFLCSSLSKRCSKTQSCYRKEDHTRQSQARQRVQECNVQTQDQTYASSSSTACAHAGMTTV